MAYPGSGPQWQPPPGGGWPPQPAGYGWAPPPPVDVKASNAAYAWFKVYVGVLTAIYLICVVVGVVLLFAPFGGSSEDIMGQRLNGAVYGFIGLVCLVVYGIGLFLPKRPWAWVYGIVLIGLGMSSCCLLPATIPLLIFWLKPEMKARFNRS